MLNFLDGKLLFFEKSNSILLYIYIYIRGEMREFRNKIFSHLTHSTSELPVKPGGQLHCLMWLLTSHSAFIPHAALTLQGSRHCPFKHTSDKLHSSSDWQDAGRISNSRSRSSSRFNYWPAILTSTDALVTVGIGRAVRGWRTNNRFRPTPYT